MIRERRRAAEPQAGKRRHTGFCRVEMIATLAVISGITLTLGWLLLAVHARLPDDDHEIIDAIDGLLPQTQCAQCGYPGCRPYAEAVAAGAAIDLCPPGGSATFEGLKALLGRGEGASPPAPEPVLARIREEECIGCFLCVRACPVDAIIGAPGYLHTVIEQECTGCELCVPVCPVDCIDLTRTAPREGALTARAGQPCIGCNRCEPVCPAQLAPRELLWLSTAGKWDAAAGLGLERCIECRLCDRVCPSDIPLAAIFADGKRTLADTAAGNAQAARAKARFEARTLRLAAERDAAQARRAQRLARRKNPAATGQSAAR